MSGLSSVSPYSTFNSSILTIRGVFSVFSLPRELLIHIFSFLDLHSVGQIPQVCKNFKVIAGDDILWKLLFSKYLPRVTPDPDLSTSLALGSLEVQLKELYNQRVVDKKKELVEHKDNTLKRLAELEEMRKSGVIVERELKVTVGENYNGTEASIDPNSVLGQLIQREKDFSISSNLDLLQAEYEAALVIPPIHLTFILDKQLEATLARLQDKQAMLIVSEQTQGIESDQNGAPFVEDHSDPKRDKAE